MATSRQYAASRVTVLEGLEPVRLRPGMYIGGADARGLENMLFEVVSNSLDQHLGRKATHVSITIDPSNTITVEDDGPGIPIEIISFVNLTETRLNGSHVNGLLKAVGSAPPSKIDQRRVVNGLVAIVHVQMSGAKFAGPTKWQLDAEPARIAVQEVVTRAINEAPWWWDRLHEAIG